MTAQNVKILVTAGRVTLRGPVPTSTERQRVYALAVGIVGGNRVDNQLEVTP